ALARLDVDLVDAPGHRRGDLDRGLVGLHLEQRRVLGDDVTLAHVHLADLGLRQSFTEIGQDEGAGHDALHCTHLFQRRPAMTVSVNTPGRGGTTPPWHRLRARFHERFGVASHSHYRRPRLGPRAHRESLAGPAAVVPLPASVRVVARAGTHDYAWISRNPSRSSPR